MTSFVSTVQPNAAPVQCAPLPCADARGSFLLDHGAYVAGTQRNGDDESADERLDFVDGGLRGGEGVDAPEAGCDGDEDEDGGEEVLHGVSVTLGPVFSDETNLCFFAQNVTANRSHDSWRCMALEAS